jgi:hypothetical protein
MSRECPSQQTHPGHTPPLLPASKSNQFIRWPHIQQLPYIKVGEFVAITAVYFRASAEYTEDEGLSGKLYINSSVDTVPLKIIHISRYLELKIIVKMLLATGGGFRIY